MLFRYQVDCDLTTEDSRRKFKALLRACIGPCIVLPYMLPALISLACCVTQAVILLRKGGSKNAINRRITVTILYLTAVFFVCNAAYCLIALIFIEGKRVNLSN